MKNDLCYRLYYLNRKKELKQGEAYLVGRGTGNDIRLPGQTVSRQHARLFWNEGHFIIEDTASLNGMFVNGAKRDNHVLYDGDHIVIGTCYLVYREFAPQDGAEVEVERELSDTLCIEHQMAELLQSISDKKIRARLFSLKKSVDRAREKLDRLANRDRLTRLYNRRYFDEELEKEIERTKRYHHDLSLLLLDLDHFKLINDNHGHRKGDQVLAAVAAVILAHTRRNDLAARYGGEEIAVVIPQLKTKQAVAAAEKIRALIEQELPERTGLTVTVSIGVALFGNQDTPADLIQKADRALYEAKRRGRNRVIVYAGKKETNQGSL